MLPFKLIYSDEYYLPIGQHVFPAEKYRRIHRRLIETGVADPADFLTPESASDRDILLVHTPAYVNKLRRERSPPGRNYSWKCRTLGSWCMRSGLRRVAQSSRRTAL